MMLTAHIVGETQFFGCLKGNVWGPFKLCSAMPGKYRLQILDHFFRGLISQLANFGELIKKGNPCHLS